MRNTLTLFAIIIFSISVNAQFRFMDSPARNEKPVNTGPDKSNEADPDGEEENFMRLNKLGVREGVVNGDFSRAIEYFKQALVIEPGCFVCKYNMGRSYIALKKYGIAEEIFAGLVRIKPDSANSLSSLGEVISLQGDDKKALPMLKKSLELNPKDSITLNNYGISLHNTGNFKKALSMFDKAIEIQSDLAEAHNYRGLTLYQLGKYKKALKSLLKANSLEPNVPEVHNNLGVVLGKLGKKKKSHEHYLDAIRLRPDFANAIFNLALNYLELGKRDEAQKQLKSLERLDATLARALRKTLWGKYVLDASANKSKN